jgi:hypothetical protein
MRGRGEWIPWSDRQGFVEIGHLMICRIMLGLARGLPAPVNSQ